MSSEVFSSTDDRVVVISKWRSAPEEFADPPAHLVARAAARLGLHARRPLRFPPGAGIRENRRRVPGAAT